MYRCMRRRMNGCVGRTKAGERAKEGPQGRSLTALVVNEIDLMSRKTLKSLLKRCRED